MANERTTVALSREAADKIAAAMKSRGETSGNYFSNSNGGGFVNPASVEGPLNTRAVTAGDVAGYTSRPGIDYVAPNKLAKYRRALVKIGLSSGAQDAELTMNLFYTPDERAAAREIAALDSVVFPATDSAAMIEARTRLSSIPKTIKWAESIDRANADYAELQSSIIDASLDTTLNKARENVRRGSDLLDGSLARTIQAARKTTGTTAESVPTKTTARVRSGGDIYDALYAPENVYRRSLSGVNRDPTHPVVQEMMQEADNPRSRVNILLREQELQQRAAEARDRSNQMMINLLRNGGTLKPGKRPRKDSDRQPSIFQRLEGFTLKGFGR